MFDRMVDRATHVRLIESPDHHWQAVDPQGTVIKDYGVGGDAKAAAHKAISEYNTSKLERAGW